MLSSNIKCTSLYGCNGERSIRYFCHQLHLVIYPCEIDCMESCSFLMHLATLQFFIQNLLHIVNVNVVVLGLD